MLFANQVRIRLIPQLVNGIARVLQTLLKNFNRTAVSKPLVPVLTAKC